MNIPAFLVSTRHGGYWLISFVGIWRSTENKRQDSTASGFPHRVNIRRQRAALLHMRVLGAVRRGLHGPWKPKKVHIFFISRVSSRENKNTT
jgi:hypothetical protein